ncbi:hypothetical protein [uncultured Holdemanella sp.]
MSSISVSSNCLNFPIDRVCSKLHL